MANNLNYDDLLTSIKRSISVPSNQARYSDADIIAFANEEIQITVLPEILRLKEEYLVYTETTSIVANQANYQIPRRAVGRGLRDVQYQSSGADTKRNLPLISLEDRHLYNQTGEPVGYYMENDKIVLLPTPGSSTGTLEFMFVMAPSKVTPVNQSYVISNINRTTGEITVTSSIDGSLASTQKWDFVSGSQANIVMNYDMTATSFSGTSITFVTTDIPTDLVAGDYVTLAGESPFIALPQEVHPVVSAAAQCRVLEGIGDYEALKYAEDKRNRAMRAMKEALAPRNMGENKKIIDRNGLLAGRTRRNFRYNS